MKIMSSSRPLRTSLLAAVALASAWWVPAALAAQVTTPQAGDLVVLGGRLWDGTGDGAVPNPGILIRNGTILRIGGVEPLGSGAEAVLLDDEHFVMPGLFDLHAHYAVDLFGEGRVDEYTVNYEFTVDDPSTFKDKIVAMVPMAKVDGQLYEYACHEGNYGMMNTLRGARMEEQRAAGGEQ